MPSFDVVSELDHHEVDNAVDQARREVSQRYDFKGTNTQIERTGEGIVITSSSDTRCNAAYEVLLGKMAKRKVPMKALKANEPKPAGGSTYRQLVELQEGIDKDRAKRIVKLLKESKLKVQASIQGDVVRVSHKKRDTLQEAIQLLKGADIDLPLQYQNFRD
ncbi:MAG TPA: YajQ family cyclic di-GMP-binding protein [Sandaracinaceae bacterium LLY-WYZ-13_1]|nr:YajQ family cyclic di-GMP-binding protein [Sandaracinaceae bacterium LLY-WYZ-13_1]